MILSLDIATTMGVTEETNHSTVTYEIKQANPVLQYKALKSLIGSRPIDLILVEEFVYFGSGNSKKTIANLLERLGYLTNRLLEDGYIIKRIYPTSYQSALIKKFNLQEALKLVKGKSKKKKVIHKYLSSLYKLPFTNNETDALGMIIYHTNVVPKVVKRAKNVFS